MQPERPLTADEAILASLEKKVRLRRVWVALWFLAILPVLWTVVTGVTQLVLGGPLSRTPNAVTLLIVAICLSRSEKARRDLVEELNRARLQLLRAPKEQRWGTVVIVCAVMALLLVMVGGVNSGATEAGRARFSALYKQLQTVDQEMQPTRSEITRVAAEEAETWEAYIARAERLTPLLEQADGIVRKKLFLLHQMQEEKLPNESKQVVDAAIAYLRADQVTAKAWLSEVRAIKRGANIPQSERDDYLESSIGPLEKARLTAAEHQESIAKEARTRGIVIPE